MIIKYFYMNGQKFFDVVQAIKDSGWGIEYENILKCQGIELIDRNDPNHRVTVASITLDKFFRMYFVSFVQGGWLCLDHAIEQFKLKGGDASQEQD